MATCRQYETTFQLLGHGRYRASMHIEQYQTPDGMRYKAIIDDSPLHGTFGAEADSIELALDFLNLAMQAEGADEITFTPQEMRAAG